MLFSPTESLKTKQKVKLGGRQPGIIMQNYQHYVYFLLRLIKSHSKVKCSTQQCRCGTDNDSGEKPADQNYTNK